MKTTDIFRKALMSFFNDKLTQSVLADSLGIQRPLMNDFIKGRRNFSEERREKISEFLGKTYLEMLILGKRLADQEAGKERPEETKYDTPLIVQVGSDREKELLEGRRDLYRSVPLYESGRLAAWSNGMAFSEYEVPENEVIVYKPELNFRSRHNLIAMKVGGNSMEPLIPENSLVIVDLDGKEFVNRKIYAVRIDEGGGVSTVAVKRVSAFEKEKAFVMLSENTEYLPRFVKDQDWPELCIGRVIWMWRTLEEA